MDLVVGAARTPRTLTTSKPRARPRMVALVAVLTTLMAFPGAVHAASAVFTVNSTGDAPDAVIGDGVCATGGTVGSDAECTLRAAIQESNASLADVDTIAFGIPTGPLTIAPATVLPVITGPVVIDATTQPGWVSAPIVELRGPGDWGLKISAGGTTIRGLVIDRFHNEIVLDGAGGNLIAGNYIGTNVAGTADGGGAGTNDQQIVVFNGSGNFIGGTSAADRNIIAGLGPTHISLRTANNVVKGNRIGTNAAGTAAIAGSPGNVGIHVDGLNATGNLIGGAVAGAGNLISGNGLAVVVSGARATIQGNLIGTDGNGTGRIPNGTGVQIGPSGAASVIGGLVPLARNVISGNTSSGIVIEADDVVIQGNFVGPDVSGTTTPGGVASNNPGIALAAARGLVGGTAAGARNVISGNNGVGVVLQNFSAIQNHIEGNLIGLDVNGDPLGNTGSGVTCCLIDSVQNVIGGTAAGAGNVIAYNGAFGVQISNNSQNAASILGNSIHSNGLIGIDLGHAAPGTFATENDPLDADSGPNGVQNYPVLDWTSTGSPTTVTGTLNSTPNSRFRLEFFHNDDCDTYANGMPDPHLGRFGEGETFLGAISVDTDTNGNGSFSTSYPVSTDATDVITATATAADGSTSEFSECRADLEITKSDDPDPVLGGGTLTYTIEVTNQGPAPALEVVVDDQLPGSGSFTLGSVLPSQGSCAPFFGPYRCSLGPIPRFGSATIEITGTVAASAGTSFSNTATVDSELRDPDPADNSATATTNVVDHVPSGTIVVRKVTVPGGSLQSFSFSASYDAADFSLSDGQSNTSGALAPGSYSVTESAVAGWDTTVACSDGSAPTAIDLADDETVTCTFTNTRRGTVTLQKTTNGTVDPARDITFVLSGPGLPAAGLSRSTFGDADGILEFGSANLIPAETYRICESPVPAGFTSFWRLDGAIVTPFNPDAVLVPPEDLGTRCYDFQVSPGQSRAFIVDNSRPGGDPRTIGYWKNWNRCTGGKQAAVADRNGGPSAGFFLVENLVPQLVGDMNVTTCQQAVNILSKQDRNGRSKSSDAAYELAAQFLAARFKLGAGAETCSQIQQAVVNAQALLDAINFTGSGDYLGSKSKDARRAQALALAATLDRYNNGLLC
jgi:uncharacterized repeat protein (TIGR01451 family)/CSLREA domain-containing protein